MTVAFRKLAAGRETPAVFMDEQAFLMQKAGGISRYFCMLAEELSRTQRIHVHLFGGISANLHLHEISANPFLHPTRCRRRDRWRINSLLARISRVWRRRTFDMVRRRFLKVIYHPSFYEVDPWIAARADATAVTFFDMIPEWLAQQAPIERPSELLDQKRAAANQAQAIIAISHATRADILKFYPELRTPIAVTHLASRLDLVGKSRGTVSATRFPKRYFLMVGNRHGYKNGMTVLRAFAKLATHTDVELIAFGGEPFSADEQAVLQENQAATRWRQVGGDDQLLAAYYGHAIGLVYPSSYEGFGLPILEAMQTGCPVITASNSSLPEVGGDAAIYVNPNNLAELAGAMSRLLESEDYRKDMIMRGRKQAARFSWEETARLTLATCLSSLDRQPQRLAASSR
jgi:glycosyltransferase involved in cell wall biosynthesis